MNNFSINKKNRNWLKYIIGAVALFVILFVLNIFVAPIKNGVYAISLPIQKTFWAAGESSSAFLGSFLNAGSLAKENINLKNENQKLLAEVASLKSIEEGSRALSDASIACQNSGFKFVMAGVIGLDDNDILSINKGSANGIAVGMPVVNQQNVLFGKIFKVYKNFSTVMLISSKNSVINVKIQKDNASVLEAPAEIDGVVKGKGGLSAYLDLIPINADISSQDILVTSAIEKSFPKDLLVARIISKEKNDQKPFQQAQISLFFNVKTTDNLFVITSYKQGS